MVVVLRCDCDDDDDNNIHKPMGESCTHVGDVYMVMKSMGVRQAIYISSLYRALVFGLATFNFVETSQSAL